MRLVTVGRTLGGESVITKGLAPGETVVLEGQFLLGPGSRVEIKNVAQSAGGKGEQMKGADEERKRTGGREKAKGASRGQS
jgi:hypothetical protein